MNKHQINTKYSTIYVSAALMYYESLMGEKLMFTHRTTYIMNVIYASALLDRFVQSKSVLSRLAANIFTE